MIIAREAECVTFTWLAGETYKPFRSTQEKADTKVTENAREFLD